MDKRGSKNSAKSSVINRIAVTAAFLLCICTVCTGCGKNKNSSDTGDGTETPVQEKNEGTETDKFPGEWRDDANNAVLDIWKDDSGLLHGEIIITYEENRLSFWSFSGELLNGELVYTDGERSDLEYDGDGDASEKTVYTRGRGTISFSGKNLSWMDAKEDAGKELIFSYYGEY